MKFAHLINIQMSVDYSAATIDQVWNFSVQTFIVGLVMDSIVYNFVASNHERVFEQKRFLNVFDGPIKIEPNHIAAFSEHSFGALDFDFDLLRIFNGKSSCKDRR